MSLNRSWKLASVTSLPCETSPRSGACQIDRRGELRQQVLAEVEVEIEAREVASGLLLDFVDLLLGKDHAARLVMRVRERDRNPPARGPCVDLRGRHRGELRPRSCPRAVSRGRRPAPASRAPWSRPRPACPRVVALGEQLLWRSANFGLAASSRSRPGSRKSSCFCALRFARNAASAAMSARAPVVTVQA